MDISIKLFFLLLWNIFSCIFGILIFTKGFLLNRLDVEQNNTCIVQHGGDLSNINTPNACMPPRYKKAVFVVIDALRYDFASFNDSVPKGEELPFQNKLPIFNELLVQKPQQSRLYRFWADPPTTTMQRIKGITTGSLPTFVDVSSNFGSAAVTEDNIIHQLLKHNKSAIFLGDDTWNDLFPNVFHRSFFYPSLDFKDLHKVDNRVLEHLEPELRKSDWDVLIAHFLGVDHCGHRFGPYHVEMTSKLQQMDSILRSVIELLDKDTVLFVFGDHGMTRTGDHGGDSFDELDAALFVYSPSTLTLSRSASQVAPVRVLQTDIVPTVSLLLGLPIPFSNLGAVITDLFNTSIDNRESGDRLESSLQVARALRVNAHQVNIYLKAYSNISQEFPYERYSELELLFKNAEGTYQEITARVSNKSSDRDRAIKLMEEVIKLYKEYLDDTRAMCEAIWAKFDTDIMLMGVLIVTSAFVFSLVVFLALSDTNGAVSFEPIKRMLIGSFVLVALAIVALACGFTEKLLVVIAMTAVCVLASVAVYRVIPVSKIWLSSGNDNVTFIISLLACFFYSVSFFSNSFVVFEDAVSNYLLITLVTVLGWQCVRRQLASYTGRDSKSSSSAVPVLGSNKSRRTKRLSMSLLFSLVGLVLAVAVITVITLRLSTEFRICREEQWVCVPTFMSKRLSTLSDDLQFEKNMRCVGCFVATAGVLYATFWWMRNYGNMNGDSLKVASIKYLLPVAAVCTLLSWGLQLLPQKQLARLTPIQTVAFARVCYLWCGATLLALIWRPLCLFVLKRDDVTKEKSPPLNDMDLTVHGADIVVPRIYQHMRRQFWQKRQMEINKLTGKESAEEPPVVFGLSTVFSSSLLVLFQIVFVLLSLVLGDSAAPALALQAAGLFLCLELFTCFLPTTSAQPVLIDAAPVPAVSLSNIVIWSMFGAAYFFATGHQASVPTIRWDAAYVGFVGDFPKWMYFIPGLLITLNTFASSILCTITLPLLILWPAFRKTFWNPSSEVNEKKSIDGNAREVDKGEFALFENYDSFVVALTRIFTGYVLVQAIKVLSAMVAAMHHKRHLMVWKIFAPRFVFQAAEFCVIGFCVLLMYLFLYRILVALQKWLKEL